MSTVRDIFNLTAVQSIYRTFAVVLVGFFLAVCVLVAKSFSNWPVSDALAEYANGLALWIGALLAMVLAHQHPPRSGARIFWWGATLGLALIAANEVFNIFDRIERAWGDDDYADLLFLCLTPIGLYAACSLEEAPRIAVRAMQLGFAFQCISDVIDLSDGDGFLFNYQIPGLEQNLMDVVTDISELIFIETYLFGLGCLLLNLLMRRLGLIGGTA